MSPPRRFAADRLRALPWHRSCRLARGMERCRETGATAPRRTAGAPVLAAALVLVPLLASAARGAEPGDALGRETPRGALTGYLDAVRKGDYERAARYLDLRRIPAAQREAGGPELARELGGVVDQAGPGGGAATRPSGGSRRRRWPAFPRSTRNSGTARSAICCRAPWSTRASSTSRSGSGSACCWSWSSRGRSRGSPPRGPPPPRAPP